MIGGGAFNLPQNMAQGAGLAAIVIAWMITLVGMFFLSNTFRTLADKRPDLKAGIYYASAVTTVSETYAREITTWEHGCGLHGLLRTRSERGELTGILNNEEM